MNWTLVVLAVGAIAAVTLFVVLVSGARHLGYTPRSTPGYGKSY